jgi:hypothetical protein
MRYNYETKRLVDIVTNMLDRANDLKDQEETHVVDDDYSAVFEKIQDMLTNLERQADTEYEHAKRQASVFSRKKVPVPAISIDSIIEYAEENGLSCVSVFPYDMKHYNVFKKFNTTFKVVSSKERFFDCPINWTENIENAKSFIILHRESSKRHLNEIDCLIKRIKQRFARLLDDNKILPDYVTLDHHNYDALHAYLRELEELESLENNKEA